MSKMTDICGISFEEIKVGFIAQYSQTITDADIRAFAGISGDNNPVHMSDEYAERSFFKKRIAHGMLSVSYFSALFGTRLPGPGCVYVSQSLKFRSPVYIGDTVNAVVKVSKININRRRVFFHTTCSVSGRIVIDGEAEIFVPSSSKFLSPTTENED